MQNRNDILNELLEISRLMAETDNRNKLYEVPVNYFESFADSVIFRIKNATQESVKTEMGMLSTIIAGIDKKKLTYSIPDNYFETFSEKILARLKVEHAKDASEELAMLSPLLSKADKKNPFTAPEGYFSELSENLVSGLNAVTFAKDELATLHPLINDLKNKSTYTVPVAYFDELSEAVLHKIKKQQPAKIVSFKKSSSWLKYAVAAAVTGIIFTIGVLTFNNKTATTDDPATGLSKISDQEITNYLDNHDNPFGETGNNNSTAALDFNDNDVSELLGSVPDNELEQYATDHTGPKDLITN
jgi:hypothetical protein